MGPMSEAAHILVVDDDPEIRKLLRDYLRDNGYRASAVADGPHMWQAFETGHFDLIVLDVMLPGDDGFTLCRNLRARSPIPIIMLTARGEETDRVVGLEMGADDYLSKPFGPRELLARIKAVLRRVNEPARSPRRDARRYEFEGWALEPEARHLRAPDGVVVPLSGAEFRLLLALVERPGRVLSRDQLLDLSRGREAVAFDRSIDVLISRLRDRLRDDGKNPAIIKTVRGEGYVFTAKIEARA
jgi:two-component system OmpR family response regulator